MVSTTVKKLVSSTTQQEATKQLFVPIGTGTGFTMYNGYRKTSEITLRSKNTAYNQVTISLTKIFLNEKKRYIKKLGAWQYAKSSKKAARPYHPFLETVQLHLHFKFIVAIKKTLTLLASP